MAREQEPTGTETFEEDLTPVRVPLDRSKLAELARAFHDDDPAWYEEEAAAAAGFDGVPAPPTVGVLVDHWREHGALAAAVATGLDLERVLHGEVEWEYLGPVRLGDELTASMEVAGVATREGKRGGAMTVVTVATEFVNQRGETVMRRRDALIETGGSG